MSRFAPKKVRNHRINGEIVFETLRLVGDGEPRIISLEDALKLSESMVKDLILINENQNPPIVKIEDYNKFLFESEKAEKERKKNSQKSDLKEIQLSCEIQDNDLRTKSRKAIEFIGDGDKVKVTIQLKGRQKNTPERGLSVMEKFVDELSEISELEAPIKLDSGKWQMVLKPIKRK